MNRLLGIALFCLCVAFPALAQQGHGITPCGAKTLAVSGSTNNVQVTTCGPQLILYNTTSVALFYNFSSSSSVTATTSNYSLPGNSFVVITIPWPVTTAWYVAAITPSGSTTLNIVQGQNQ